MRKLLRLTIAVVLLLALFPATFVAAQSGGQDPGLVPGQLVIAFRPGTSLQQQDAVISRIGGTVVFGIPEIDVAVVRVAPGQEASALQQLRRERVVQHAAQDVRIGSAQVPGPNDPLLSQQWYVDFVQARQAWQMVGPGRGTIIAVVDDGIDVSHPDLQGKIVDFVIAPGISPLAANPSDGRHGTHVAGTAAAATNNGIGVAGICPTCRILAIRAYSDFLGQGSVSTAAWSIVYAANHGARVINMSFGFQKPGDFPDIKPIGDRALAYAARRGVVLVAAAGNDRLTYPRGFPQSSPLVISVAALTPAGSKADFSRWGRWVAIGAPGVQVLAPVRGGGYAPLDGTSMASPIVAGVVGLMFESGICSTASCAQTRLLTSATTHPGLNRYWPAGRIVNACRAATNEWWRCAN
ncbi:Thermophilic serine proteinase [bacterium HR28]|nr:Thermophilic serine proteinase [bacterium HR28]